MARLNAALKNLTAFVGRAMLAEGLGLTHGGRRDLYRIFGYRRHLDFEDFFERFDRQGVAHAVITRPVEACWGTPPEIVESNENDTEFEKSWTELAEALQVFSCLERLDVLARIGKYAVLLLGFDDGGKFKEPVNKKAGRLLYLTPYAECHATIASYDKDSKSPRFNLPEIYKIRMRDGSTHQTVDVHHSRILHVAEDPLENPIEGHPQLKAIFNNLQSLELITGASPEMYWRAVARLGLKVEQDARLTKEEIKKTEEEVGEYTHDYKPWMLLDGIDAKVLTMDVADPSPHVQIQIDQIAAKTGYPKRWLMGAELGELSSSQDAQHVAAKIGRRQLKHCEARILRPLIDRLIEFTVLEKPVKKYSVKWPPVIVRGEKEQAEIGEIDARALSEYSSSPGAETIVPPEIFRTRNLRFTKDEEEKTQKILSAISADGDEEEAQAEAAAREEAEAAAAAAGAEQ